MGLSGFAALQAVILNKPMSFVVVLTALPARLFGVPFADLAASWTVAANLLAGSLVGAWVGATWATRMRSTTLYRILAGLLVLIAEPPRPSGVHGRLDASSGSAATLRRLPMRVGSVLRCLRAPHCRPPRPWGRAASWPSGGDTEIGTSNDSTRTASQAWWA